MNSWQNALVPASPQAHRVATLFWWMLVVAAVVYLIVLVAFALAGRRRRALPPDAVIHPDASTERAAIRNVTIAGGVTIVILIAFMLADFGVARALGNRPGQMMTIDVEGHQWWWEVHYVDAIPQNQVTTANEIHIPVGVPVQFRLTSHDVIHSFWVPNMQGKRDLVPGYQTSTWFKADTPGVYRGQCAEFCGMQHAKMALVVVAQSQKDFDRWLTAQRQPAMPPDPGSDAAAGQKIFMAGPCSTCHHIAGTDAYGTIGPDLTHLASRLTIAAGTLPNSNGNLGGWIVNPQAIKPGTQMPANALDPTSLNQLLAYLETLR